MIDYDFVVIIITAKVFNLVKIIVEDNLFVHIICCHMFEVILHFLLSKFIIVIIMNFIINIIKTIILIHIPTIITSMIIIAITTIKFKIISLQMILKVTILYSTNLSSIDQRRKFAHSFLENILTLFFNLELIFHLV